MRIFIDIAHPAYAHALRHFITAMKERGHEVLVTARDKDMTHCLLREWGIEFIDRGGRPGYGFSGPAPGPGNPAPGSASGPGSPAPGSASGPVPGSGPASGPGSNNTASRLFPASLRRMAALAGKVWYLLRVVGGLLPVVRRFRPHLVISWSSYHAALMGRLLGVPVLTFEDTESSVLLHRVNRFLSTRMVTPAAFEAGLGRKHIRFDGWKELASLHPSRFTPAALPDGVEKPYIIMRFVSWNAWHDKGHTGMSDAAKREVVGRLSEFGTVYISSEKPLPAGMNVPAIPGGCADGHTLLAGASLFFGESACMAAEAAVLGVPAFFIDNDGRGYTRELERLGLLFGYGEDDGQVAEALEKAVSLLSDPQTTGEWQRRRRKALEDKPDLTALMIEMAVRFSALSS